MKAIVSLAALTLLGAPARAGDTDLLTLVQTIPLPDVKGRIDHLAVDIAGQRLYVAALGNGTVEVLDLKAGARVHSIGGLAEPQGILFVANNAMSPTTQERIASLGYVATSPGGTIVVASGGDGTVKFFDATSFELTRQVDFDDDADNLRYDTATKRVWVAFADGGVGFAEAGKRAGEIQLGGHPESFQLEANSARLFANVPSRKRVAVVDREKRTVVATWPVEQAESNFPMALDETSHRLFVGCRKPASLVVLDTTTGKPVAHFPIGGDVDDLFFDASRKRLYAACGEGTIDVFEPIDADHYKLIGKTKTSPGARTALLVPAMDRLFVAVPRREDAPAEVRAYDVRAK